MAAGQQSMTVEKLVSFVKSQLQFIKEKKGTDKELAKTLATIKLTEKLDSGVIEELQALGLGENSLRALQKLREQSQALAAPNLKFMLPDEPEPPPTSLEQGAILDAVREYVAHYDSTLPDYICTEMEMRSIAPKPGTHGTRPGSDPSYQAQDTITSSITYFDRHEKKKAILQGSRPLTTEYTSLGGTTSEGDFGERLHSLFDPASEARFEWDHWATLRHRPTVVFSYHVEQSRSQLTVSVKDEHSEAHMAPAYHGLVWIDVETRAVTKLAIHAEAFPPGFPVESVEETLDYRYTDIAGQQFLLPYYAEIVMNVADMLSKNDLAFLFYKKYSADSAISYDVPADTSPIPADQLKESPGAKPPDCKNPKNKDLAACKAGPATKKK